MWVRVPPPAPESEAVFVRLAKTVFFFPVGALRMVKIAITCEGFKRKTQRFRRGRGVFTLRTLRFFLRVLCGNLSQPILGNTILRTMNLRLLALLLVSVFSMSVCAQKGPSAESAESRDTAAKATITYIANEGVLIEGGGKTVLIDGLHRFYKSAYAHPPDELRDKLENAKSPYDRIDLVLVSHLHGDHFHPASVALHLKNNRKAKLATSEQIIEKIKEGSADYRQVVPQIVPIKHKWKGSISKEFDGIRVRFLGLRHGSERFKWIQNLGHVIEIGGKKFLHIGDADMTAENFSAFEIDKEGIDIGFIPYWFLLSEKGRKLVKDQFAPKHIVAVHVSPSDADEVTNELNKHYADITVFTRILESRAF